MSRATRALRRQYVALADLAGALRAQDRTVEALARYREALEGAEQLAAIDGRRAVDVLVLRADIAVQEGILRDTQGWGASAVLHLDRAVSGYLQLSRASRRQVNQEQLALATAPALVVNAEVLMWYGDPQLAAAAADLGFRLYLGQHGSRGWNVPQMANLAKSASGVLARTGHLANAVEADEIAVKAFGETAAGSGSADDRRRLATAQATMGMHLLATGDVEHRPQAAHCLAGARDADAAAASAAQDDWARIQALPPVHTVAEALRVADRVPTDLPETYTAPPFTIVTPSGRSDPGLAAIDAGKLAGVAVELLPRLPAEGLRIGLEAHYLFAAGAMAAPLGEREAATWAGLVLALCHALDDDPDRATALPLSVDLAAQNIRMIDVLLPDAGGDPALGQLLRDCVDHHAELLDRTDDQSTAEDVAEVRALLARIDAAAPDAPG
ncbi:hypothetical protein HH310_29485 [Actinoplanes sp. TBRC 11911]|uniref:hypothetical protein n=1 Tax=Actinoplanes sp. TBRC 11911 TaxID=2729386 RepID=UPI00145CD7F8|nr:hypothetical protein [Actinoplanes sp. TBRC 11911]NMO55304.1 hypothetical protein [Actinoplanes sp. TBRC 11911]